MRFESDSWNVGPQAGLVPRQADRHSVEMMMMTVMIMMAAVVIVTLMMAVADVILAA